MKFCTLSLMAVLLMAGPGWAQDDAVDVETEVEAQVAVEATVEPAPRGSLRDEYRQWAGTSRTTTRERRDVDSVDDIESAPRNVEEWWNEDVANTDRETRVAVREVRDVRYANYPEYDVDTVRAGDRMYDDTDRRGDRYWSRSYGDVRYYDSRTHGCGCKSCDGCRVVGKCGAKCGTRVAAKAPACGKCGVKSKCGAKGKCGVKCACPQPAVKAVAKCGRKCGAKCGAKCATHKPAVKAVAKCGSKCGAKCGKCGPKVAHKAACTKCGVSRKCRNC